MNLMNKVQNIQISNTQQQDTNKSQMGTGLEETLRYALDYLECYVLVTT